MLSNGFLAVSTRGPSSAFRYMPSQNKHLVFETELKLWVEKVDKIRKQTKTLHVYFNNHYGGKAVVNALQFKATTGYSLSEIERNALEHAEKYLSNHGLIEHLSQSLCLFDVPA